MPTFNMQQLSIIGSREVRDKELGSISRSRKRDNPQGNKSLSKAFLSQRGPKQSNRLTITGEPSFKESPRVTSNEAVICHSSEACQGSLGLIQASIVQRILLGWRRASTSDNFYWGNRGPAIKLLENTVYIDKGCQIPPSTSCFQV